MRDLTAFGKVNQFVAFASVLTRSSCSGCNASLWGRRQHPFRIEPSLQQVPSLSLAPLLHAHPTLQRKTVALVEARPRRVASRSPPESRSGHRRHQFRCASGAELGMVLGQRVAASRSAAHVVRARERVSSASAFARFAQSCFPLPCFRLRSASNKLLVPTPVTKARFVWLSSGAAQQQRWA